MSEQPGGLLGLAFRVYKAAVSPVLHAISPAQCKFLPTCSEYGYVAVARHGVLKGSAMAFWRLARCHPFARGGLDPVPARGVGVKGNVRGKESPGAHGASKSHHLS